MSLSAIISNISRSSLHDGPGVRTVVYLKGCALRCAWCHNPETLSAECELAFLPSKCIGCGRCVAICPSHHALEKGELHFLRDGCVSCGKCAQNCPTGALALVGERMDDGLLWDEIKKDQHYYSASGGGVTFSGGECLLQADFVASVARRCAEIGIHVAIETALFVPWKNVEKVSPYTNLFLCDLKIADSQKHRKYIGQGNERILENLRRISEGSVPVIVRIPVIPKVNDGEEDMTSFAAVLRTLGNAVLRVELLKYNTLAASKYDMIGREYKVFAKEPQSDARMQTLARELSRQSGLPCTV